MGYHFKDYNPDQFFLLPPSLDEWLPTVHRLFLFGLNRHHNGTLGKPTIKITFYEAPALPFYLSLKIKTVHLK